MMYVIHKRPEILFVYLAEPPWQYYILFEQYLNELQHPFQHQVHILRDIHLSFPEKIFQQYHTIAFFFHDPLAPLYPKQYQYALRLQAFCAERNILLINTPQALSQSSKSVQLNLLFQAGFPVARCYALHNVHEIHQLPHNEFPFFLRYNHGHDSRGEYYLGPYYTHESLTNAYKTNQAKGNMHLGGLAAVQWIDTKCADGLYRKYRVYATPFKVIPAFMSRSSEWFIHCDNPENDTLAVSEDDAFIHQPIAPNEEHLFRSVCKCLGFSFCGIDYAYRPNGDIIVWEANPHPGFDGTEVPVKLWVTDLLAEYYGRFLRNTKG